jgi:hypothetical protein
MTTLPPPSRRISRRGLIGVVVAVLGVALVLSAVFWNAHRNGSHSTPPGAAAAPVASHATNRATPSATASRRTTKAPKSKAAPKVAVARKLPAKKVGSTVVTGRALPAGIVEPGRKIAPPVAMTKPSVADTVRVGLTGFTAIKSKASGPGEISAPAVRFTIRLTNTGAKPLTLTSVVVNAYYGKAGTPGIGITGDPSSKPFTGSLGAGATRSAVYVFDMPVSKRRDATITVSASPTLPIAIFAGSVA